MKNELLDKGIILPSGEINKDKINLVAGAITQPFAEMVWVTTGGDMETVNRLTDILVTMNTPADREKLFKILKMLYGLMGLPFSEEAEPIAGELTQEQVKEFYTKAQEQKEFYTKAQEQPETIQGNDTFSIYQLKGGEETRDFRFEPYDRLQATGKTVERANYELIYTAPLTAGTSLEDIFTRFNIDHPKDFKGHSLSVSDVVVLHQNGENTAHYVDSIGYKEVPEFLQPENPLKAAEQTTEQNYNMIDGQINNTPTAAELEAKAKAGEQISLFDYAKALKEESRQEKAAKPEKKPSIRAQLRADKERAAQKKPAKQKSQDIERS